MAEFYLKYGHQTLCCSLEGEHLLGVLCPSPLPPLFELGQVVREILEHPIGSPPLREVVRPGQQVVVVVPDRTRRVRQEVYLPILLDYLNSAGIPDKHITVVFAIGYHRGQTREEMEAVVGSEVSGRVELVNHNCHDRSAMAFLGMTTRGTPVWLNRRVVEADRVILTGGIVPHYFAGFGGGAKALNPGVAARETIAANHLLTLRSEGGTGLHPLCRDGVLEGNPVYEDIVESARMHPPHFLLNLVQDMQGEVVAVFAGDYLKAHRVGCRFVREHFFVPIREKADMVVVSCGGFPKDINFIQSHKSVHHGFYALRPGGTMIVLAECPEGVGSPTFLDWFDCDDLVSLRRKLQERYTINGHTALVTLEKALSARIILVSRLDPGVVERMRMVPAGSLKEALDLVDRGQGLSTYIIPHGAVTVPYSPEN